MLAGARERPGAAGLGSVQAPKVTAPPPSTSASLPFSPTAQTFALSRDDSAVKERPRRSSLSLRYDACDTMTNVMIDREGRSGSGDGWTGYLLDDGACTPMPMAPGADGSSSQHVQPLRSALPSAGNLDGMYEALGAQHGFTPRPVGQSSPPYPIFLGGEVACVPPCDEQQLNKDKGIVYCRLTSEMAPEEAMPEDQDRIQRYTTFEARFDALDTLNLDGAIASRQREHVIADAADDGPMKSPTEDTRDAISDEYDALEKEENAEKLTPSTVAATSSASPTRRSVGNDAGVAGGTAVPAAATSGAAVPALAAQSFLAGAAACLAPLVALFCSKELGDEVRTKWFAVEVAPSSASPPLTR